MPELECNEGRLPWIHYWVCCRQRISLGQWGEWIALRYLVRKEWDVLCRNWTSGRGELDLVAFEEEDLVVVEVKTRHMDSNFLPETNVTDEKRKQLERLGQRFRLQHEMLEQPLRFDLIAIETPDRRRYSIRHYRGIL